MVILFLKPNNLHVQANCLSVNFLLIICKYNNIVAYKENLFSHQKLNIFYVTSMGPTLSFCLKPPIQYYFVFLPNCFLKFYNSFSCSLFHFVWSTLIDEPLLVCMSVELFDGKLKKNLHTLNAAIINICSLCFLLFHFKNFSCTHALLTCLILEQIVTIL